MSPLHPLSLSRPQLALPLPHMILHFDFVPLVFPFDTAIYLQIPAAIMDDEQLEVSCGIMLCCFTATILLSRRAILMLHWNAVAPSKFVIPAATVSKTTRKEIMKDWALSPELVSTRGSCCELNFKRNKTILGLYS
ncbi:unnamed protein product [Cuscuta campestris]|uniref:Uncharacterized protein n=1 Tax=Cuscuta campestris TaxID=132261 RepID=A0A484L2X7_9ASTE|nr:unnamed protein product [Cuscuta campestris]